jgi:hypothetical protein
VPVTDSEHSWVARSAASHTAGSTLDCTTTACRYPVPSRTIKNWIFPEERRL